MTGELRAGVARADITPPVGISMAGYYSRDGVSTGVERPLTATALVLTNGEAKIAIVACDLIFIQSPAVDEIRQSIGEAIGTDAASVLINCSHTHCGPSPLWGPWENDHQERLQQAYMANLKNLLVGCAWQADRQLQPARIGSGAGAASIGINRREKGEDGKIFLGENPSGPMDTEVGVIRVDRKDGSPIAALFSYGCHTVTMGPKNLRLSPDFPGPARELVESATGAAALFLQAAGGDINPITGIGPTEDDTQNMTRLGYALGAEAVKVMMAIRTHQKRGPRGLFPSLSRNVLFPYVPIEDTPAEIDCVSQSIKLPLLPFPSIEDARQILEMHRQRLEAAEKDGLPAYRLVPYRRFHDWAKIMFRHVESGEKQISVPVNFQAIRVNDIALASVSGEAVVELGLAVKSRSPFERTFFLGYSNGCVSYLPTAACYPDEGWSPYEIYSIPDMLFQSYQVPMAFAPVCGELIVEHAVGLLEKVAGTRAVVS